MKINSVKLTDFRCYEKAEVIFDQPLSFLRGNNHSGKTSLAQAIKLALSKCADGTDSRGAGALDKVRLGANKAIIETVIEGKQGLVTLTTQYGPGKTGRTQKIVTDPVNEKIADGFDKYLDANQERLSCCLDSAYFTSQKPEAQKAILATLVLPTSYEFDPEMVALAEKHLGAFIWDKSPVAVIDQVYEAAYGGRRTAKATLAGIRIPNKPQQPEHSAEVVQEKLGKLRTAAAKESKVISGGGTVQIGRIEQSLEQERQKAATANADLAAAATRSDEIDAALITDEQLQAIEALAKGRKLFDQLQTKINAASSEIRAQKEAQAIYAELLQDDAGNDVDHANCPTCTQAITRAFIDGKIAEHAALAKEAAAMGASLVDEQKQLGDIVGAEQKLEANARVIQDGIAIGRTIKDLQTRIEASQAAIESLTAQLTQAPADEKAPADTRALDALNAEITTWETRLSPAVNYNATLEQIKTLTAQWVEQKDTVDDLEVLCEHFGKDGIKAELIAKHIGEFSETVNSVLAAWGYSAVLQMELVYGFLVTTPTGELPLKELSGSERLMFAAALQVAIAFHSKVRLVVIDAADVLVAQERNRLFACVSKALTNGTLDQSIILLSEKEKTIPPVKPGVGWYWIERGKIERM